MNFSKSIYISSLITFYSCISVGKISIQLEVPPKYFISPDIQSIAILNRSLTSDFTNAVNYSIEAGIDVPYGKVIHDSTAADTVIKTAARAIFASERFDVVIPLQMNVLRDDTIDSLPSLDSVFINMICENFNVQAVLVLEYFNEKINRYGYHEEENHGKIINLLYDAKWTFHQPTEKTPVLSFKFNDVLSWKCQTDHYFRKQYDILPTVKEALISGGLVAGVDIANQICPRWEDEIRQYFIIRGKNMDDAVSLIKKDKWTEAEYILLKYLPGSNKSLRSRIEYNLALVAEMNGNTDQAKNWVKKSLNTKYSKIAERYRRQLN